MKHILSFFLFIISVFFFLLSFFASQILYMFWGTTEFPNFLFLGFLILFLGIMIGSAYFFIKKESRFFVLIGYGGIFLLFGIYILQYLHVSIPPEKEKFLVEKEISSLNIDTIYARDAQIFDYKKIKSDISLLQNENETEKYILGVLKEVAQNTYEKDIYTAYHSFPRNSFFFEREQFLQYSKSTIENIVGNGNPETENYENTAKTFVGNYIQFFFSREQNYKHISNIEYLVSIKEALGDLKNINADTMMK